MKTLSKLSNDDNLPPVLVENTIQAEPLLFREAQLNYSKRRRTIQRQIVIDNLHFDCKIEELLEILLIYRELLLGNFAWLCGKNIKNIEDLLVMMMKRSLK